MNRGTGRRRLRLRRKRKGEGSSSKDLIGPRRADVADDSKSFVREAGEEVVFETGCCLVEAVLSCIALFALFTVPAYLMLG